MASKISRRDFLKGTAAGAAALTLTGLGLGKAPAAEAAGLGSAAYLWRLKKRFMI